MKINNIQNKQEHGEKLQVGLSAFCGQISK